MASGKFNVKGTSAGTAGKDVKTPGKKSIPSMVSSFNKATNK